MALSQAQLDQRRAAGRALAAKVDRSYYQFIGRRGGRKLQFNILMGLAATWLPSPDVAALGQSPAHTARLIEAMRYKWREEAYEKYFDQTGTCIMLALFEKELPQS